MNKTKIQTVLSEVYGITDPLNRWIKLPQISVIYLDQDANIYVNENCLFYFNSNDNTLNLAQNYVYKNLSSQDIKSSLDSYLITSRFDLNKVAGFINTVVSGPYGTYINRRF